MAPVVNEVDQIFTLIGLGRWQIFQCFWLVTFYLAWTNIGLSIVVIGYVPEFGCNRPINSSVMGNQSVGPVFDNQCFFTNMTDNSSQPCVDGFVYNEPKHISIVSEWDLVCGKTFASEVSQSALSIGQTLGALLFTPLSDKFGRRRIVIYAHAGFAIVTAATAFVPNIWVFIASRLITGALIFGAGMISWVMTLELFTPKHRTKAALVTNIVWAVCTCTLPGIGYLMDGRSWRHIQLVFSVFSVLWIGQLLTLKESVRWLLANGRTKEAFVIIKQAMKTNRTDKMYEDKLLKEYFSELSSQHLLESNRSKKINEMQPNVEAEQEKMCIDDSSNSPSNLTESVNKSPAVTASHLYRHPVLRKVTLTMMFAWFTNSLVYFGIFMLSSTMSGNRYMNLFLVSVVDIPASIIIIPLTLRFGRRTLCIGYHVLAGVSVIIASIIHVTAYGGIGTIIQTCAFIVGKFSITSSFMVIYLYTPELYPTNIRSIGLGFADTACRLGSLLAPFAATVARAYPWVPTCIFGVLCLLVSVFSIVLPETANKDLPQTLQDINRLEKKTQGQKANC